MTKNDDKRIPALRFKGFNDDWAQRKLGDYITVNKIKNKENNHFIPYSISNKWGFIPQEKQFGEGNTYSKTNKATNYIVEPNTFAYNPARINVGSIAYQNNQFPVIVSSLYEIFKAKKNLNDEFLMNWFKTEKFTRQIQKLQEGGVRQYFFIDKMQESRITIPFISEQEEISKTLNQISNLIKLQQRKEKLLKQIQQAIYYNIYPEYGTKIPIIRHREFNKDWSIVSFNKLYKKSKEKNDLTYGEDKIISVAKMYFKHESQNSSKDYLKTYNVFKKGDIAFEGNRSEGFSHGRFVQNNIGDGIVSHVFDVFTPLNKENLNYWKYAIHNEHIMKYVLVKSTTKATMMNNLSTKDFLKQKIAVPNSCEMKKISHLLKGLDDQLEFSKRKIKILTKVKQFLLQNMFI